MSEEIKTDDIIRSLWACADHSVCDECAFTDEGLSCSVMLLKEAANRLEELQKVVPDCET